MFCSFFFVLDARGIKLLTKDCLGQYRGPYEVLRGKLPALDWNYMLKRENGELLMDLSVSFHPEDLTPMVGLWKLDHVGASFAKVGTNELKVFHAAAMAGLGGMQAEVPRDRVSAVQLVYRLAYNLIFELVRHTREGAV
jgi:hypothetical protein